MTPTIETTIDVNEVLNALEVFINKRPGLDWRDYGNDANGRSAYRSEVRSIAKDKARAVAALAYVRRSVTHDPALLADSFKRAFSGRLEWKVESVNASRQKCASCLAAPGLNHAETCTGGAHALVGRLSYCTGQYFPTEYRKAAASVLETYKSLLNQKWAAEHPQKFQFKSLADVKAANAAIGGHWFERGSMRFFDTRIESKLMTRGSSGRQVFITSDQYHGSQGSEPRKYTIREALTDGSIDTVGEFQQYLTLEDAKTGVMLLS